MLLGLFIGSHNYGVNLGYLFTFLLAGVGTLSMLHTQRNLAGLELRAGQVAPVFAGEVAVFPLQLANPGRLPRYHLRLLHPEAPSEAIDLAAASHGQLELHLLQAHRGRHQPGRLVLESTWPFGLFRCWAVFQLDWSVLVYPAPATGNLPLPPATGDGQGDGLAKGGEEDEFAGLRDYHPGDSLHGIAWKVYARGQGLYTKQFAGQARGQLWLDWQQPPEREPEARLSRLTRWALDAERAGLAWGLSLPTGRMPPGRGEVHLRDGLARLATFPVHTAVPR